ncbi:MAG: bifunctional folylpolyglutamate synthase/dihydrofolate synthase [Candidatus Sumerlaeaceae bacterium]
MNLSTYDEAAAFLDSQIDYEKLLSKSLTYDTKNFDLANFRGLLRELGDPHLKYAVIHIAGTKGKGSTCAFLASALANCGCKVGLYTSPHIDRYTERIQVNGLPVPDPEFARLMGRLGNRDYFRPDRSSNGHLAASADSPGFRTVFELLTAAAFLYFAEQEVDIAVIETGLGGRLDSTNVFDQPGAGPLLNVITAIGYDHTAILGKTIEQIASEKVGIVQPHGICVLGPQPLEWAEKVRASLEQRLRETGREEYLEVSALIDGKEALEERPDGTSSPDLTMAEYTLDAGAAPPDSLLAQTMVHGLNIQTRMHGAHQIDNIRTCLGTLLALESCADYQQWASSVLWRHPGQVDGLEHGFPAELVRRGIAKTRWPGRFEIVSRYPLEIVDGAHCPLSTTAMVDAFRDLYGAQEVILVVGFLRDKEPEEICSIVKANLNVAAIVCCSPPTPRGLPAQEAAEILKHVYPEIPVEAVPDPEQAVRGVLQLREEDQAVLIFGSMYIVGSSKRVCKEYGTAISDFGARV